MLRRIAETMILCSLLMWAATMIPAQTVSSVPNDYLRQLTEFAGRKIRPAAVSSIADPADQGGKCGLWFVSEVGRNWNNFSAEQKQVIRSVMQPPQLQKNRTIGHFRVYYDTSTSTTPALLDANNNRIANSAEEYVDSVGAFFNHAWEYEIDVLGFPPPPLQPGESAYQIYIQNLKPKGWYGVTNFDLNTDTIDGFNPRRYRTYIEVDNDFGWDISHTYLFFSPGMKGLKVTAAHEFNHAIQLGNFGYWPSDLFFYEITSTWLEDVVYHGVNDYFQYIRSSIDTIQPRGQFATPEVAFTSFTGLLPYSRMIWGKFIEKRYSSDLMLQTWYAIRHVPPLFALDQALSVAGSSFRQAFLEWSVWNTHTGPNSDPVKYYTEGKSFPLIRQRPMSTAYLDAPASFSDSIGAVSSVYRPVCVLKSTSDTTACDPSHQMLVIVSNINIGGAASQLTYPFLYLTMYHSVSGYKGLANGLFVTLSVPDPENWSTQETVGSINPEVTVYPNPFRSRENRPLTFRLPTASVLSGVLSIYSSSMDLVDSKELGITPYDFLMRWDAKDRKGNVLPSGIYIYSIMVGGEQYTGKFAVVRE